MKKICSHRMWEKPKTKIVILRDYKNFSVERFHSDFLSEIEKYLDC